MKIERTSGKRWRNSGPYSTRLARGPVATVDGRSAEGRYIRALEAELIATLPGPISVTDRLLIDRLIRLRLQLDALENKIEEARAGRGKWTDHDIRVYSAVGNQYRLTLRELRTLPTNNQPKKRGRPSAARLLVQAAAERPTLASMLAETTSR
jgi:hypothetical protein